MNKQTLATNLTAEEMLLNVIRDGTRTAKSIKKDDGADKINSEISIDIADKDGHVSA